MKSPNQIQNSSTVPKYLGTIKKLPSINYFASLLHYKMPSLPNKPP